MYIILKKYFKKVELYFSPYFIQRVLRTLFTVYLGQDSALPDWFQYLKPVPCLRLAYRPDDGGSSHL
jgi:hypothetical protein